VAKQTLHELKAAFTKNPQGLYDPKHAGMLEELTGGRYGMDWRKLTVVGRLDLLEYGLSQMVWGLDSRDAETLAHEFVRDELRQQNDEARREAGMPLSEERGDRHLPPIERDRSGSHAGVEVSTGDCAEQLKEVRPVTRNLIESLLLHLWPGPAAMADFGLDSRRQYEALYYPIVAGEIKPKALDGVLGDGRKLTELVRQARSNPHKDVTFHTAGDRIAARNEAGDDRPAEIGTARPSPSQIAELSSPPDFAPGNGQRSERGHRRR
jgi:hypothetical protein